MFTTDNVHDSSSTQTALDGTCPTNERIIDKDILYGEHIADKRNLWRTQLRYRGLCKRDMKDLEIDVNNRGRTCDGPLQVEKLPVKRF